MLPGVNHRYIAIVQPIRAHILCSRHRATLVIATIWPLALACALPTVLFNTVRRPHPRFPADLCVIDFPGQPRLYALVHRLVEFVVFFCVPLVVQIVLYSIIGRRLFVGHGSLQHRLRHGGGGGSGVGVGDGVDSVPLQRFRLPRRLGDLAAAKLPGNDDDDGLDEVARRLSSTSTTATGRYHVTGSGRISGNRTAVVTGCGSIMHQQRTLSSAGSGSGGGGSGGGGSGGGGESDAMRARKGVVKMLIASVTIYCLSYAPAQLPLVYGVFWPSQPFRPNWSFVVLLMTLAYVNSAANPILYGIFSQNFRCRFGRVMPCCVLARTGRRGRYGGGGGGGGGCGTGLAGGGSPVGRSARGGGGGGGGGGAGYRAARQYSDPIVYRKASTALDSGRVRALVRFTSTRQAAAAATAAAAMSIRNGV